MNQSRKTSVQGNGRQNDPYATQRHTMSQPPQNKNSRAKDLIWLVVIIAVTIILTIFFMNKCNNNDTIQLSQPSADSTFKTPDNNVTSSEATQNIKKGEEFVAKKKKEDPNIKTSSTGLSYKILSQGTGTKPSNNDTVKVKYTGKLLNGKVFDSSNDNAVEFPLNSTISGFSEGIKMLGSGGKATLYIPANLAYGEQGIPSVGIGPNEMLIFEIELIEIIGVDTTIASETSETTNKKSNSISRDKAVTDFLTDMFNNRKYNSDSFLEKHCTNSMLKTLRDNASYETYGETYGGDIFRGLNQDSGDGWNDYHLISVDNLGNNWYKYTFIDGGERSSHKIKIIGDIGNFKIADLKGWHNSK